MRAVLVGGGVEDLPLAALQIFTQVAVSPGGAAGSGQFRRNGSQDGSPGLFAQALVVAEEEELVFMDRSAHRSAELIVQVGREVFAGERIRRELGKWVARLLGIGAAILEGRAVETHCCPTWSAP